MTRTAWFHCHAGTAGDMSLAALVDAGADPAEVARLVAGLGLEGYALTFEPVQRGGIAATHAVVTVHEHRHHRPWHEVRGLLERADLPPRVRERSLAVYRTLAEVEATIHRCRVDDVELHEVGALDAIVDIVGTCAALEVLGVDQVACSPITVGHGTIDAAHGQLPNPSPAVVSLLARAGAPCRGIDDHLEVATPTGVALMTVLAASFGPLPAMASVEAVGYGAGTRDVPGRPNVLQVVVGEAASPAHHAPTPGQPVRLLEANVDDVTGEVLAHTIAALLEAGAHDAWATPIVMKKGRPATTVHALCDPVDTDAVAEVLVRETGTLGLRGSVVERWPQSRTEVVVDLGSCAIRVKLAAGRAKVEHDDALAAARTLGLPLREVLARAEAMARAQAPSD
jgi:uncharacterized protein (TIGR00299 family) protein